MWGEKIGRIDRCAMGRLPAVMAHHGLRRDAPFPAR